MTNTNGLTPAGGNEDETERERVLSQLADSIETVRKRIAAREEAGLDDPEDERLQIKWLRTQGYLTGQYRKLMKDTDIDEMEDDVELLRKAMGDK